jgi:hypothetical protein
MYLSSKTQRKKTPDNGWATWLYQLHEACQNGAPRNLLILIGWQADHRVSVHHDGAARQCVAPTWCAP